MSCNKTLAEGQWWAFCGETDMGQTSPVLCTECGGEFELMSDADIQKRKAKNSRDKLEKEKWIKENPIEYQAKLKKMSKYVAELKPFPSGVKSVSYSVFKSEDE